STKANQKPTTQGTPQINLAEKDNEIIAVIVVEANLVENKEDWILDTGASRHFCSNKALFHELLETTDGECVFMGNSTTAGVLGKGQIILKLTSGKTLALIDILYVSSLHRNLVSGRKGYLSDGLFVLNTVPAMFFNKNSPNSAYFIESIDVWHGRLGYVNYSSIKRLNNVNLIKTSDAKECSKCEVCVEAKYAMKPFKSVTSRSTEVLELIHSDLADFKNTLSKGGQEVEWLKNLLGDVPLWGSTVSVSLHCDSQGAIKELLKNGIISLNYVRFERNLADPLTKGLVRRIIFESSRAMGLKPLD
ncbi:UNVERIFIED_CONTAM: hypothetical protein Sradi_2682900, partial [Sesamum radiatum]